MKKNILLSAFILFTAVASAQFTTWEDDFNDGEAADWTFLDVDGNTSTWSARKNLELDPETGAYINGNIDILGTYNIDFSTGSYYPENENNWAITPVQDLSFYTGTIQLVINAQVSAYGGSGQDFLVYVSNSPDRASFLQNVPVTVSLTRNADEGQEFQERVVDLSQYAGQEQVYIAIVRGAPQFVGIEINDIKITASAIAGVDDVATSVTMIKQNPVSETLAFQLGTGVNADALSISVYTMSGVLVKETKYSEAGIAVSGLAAGMYFAVLNDGAATAQLKFIKK